MQQKPKQTVTLRKRLVSVLDNTTQNDARWTYRAIQLAAPGGLGKSEQQDVHTEPEVNLKQAMALASHRDHIAYQFNNQYSTVFEMAMAKYRVAFSQWNDPYWVTVVVFLDLLRQIPDSHIERKFGAYYTPHVTAKAADLFEKLSNMDDPELILSDLKETDVEFKSKGINPGTTADLTVACLLAIRLEALLACR